MPKFLLYGGIGLVVVIVIVVIVSVLSHPKTTTPTKTGTNTNGKIVLNWWHPLDSPDVLKPIIAAYQEANPKVTINLVQKPLSSYEDDATNALAAGNGPDIWSIPNSLLPKEFDKLTPASEGMFAKNKNDTTTNLQYFKDKYVPVVVNENFQSSKLYGIPLFVDTLALFANKNLLRARYSELSKQQVKVNDALFTTGPQTWNDFVDLVEQYTVKDGAQITKPAVALGQANNVNDAKDIVAALMLQNGATMISPDNLTATFNLPQIKATKEQYYPGKEALQFFLNFANPASPTYTWNASFPNSYEAFRDGKVAMILDYQQGVYSIYQEVPTFSLATWPLPQIKSSLQATDMASYWTETVPKAGQHQAEAWAFVQYLATTAQGQYQAATTRPSPKVPASGAPLSILQRTNSGNPLKFQTMSATSWYRGLDPAKFEALFTQMIQAAADKPADLQKIIDAEATNITQVLRSTSGYLTNPSATPQPQTSPTN